MEEKEEKEVNLIDLISIFFGWIRKTSWNLVKGIGQVLRMAFRHKVMISILIVASVVVALYMARPSARVYSAEGTALLHGNDAQTVREVFRQLENSVSKDDLISLSTKLGLEDSVTKNIIKLNSYYLIDYMRDSVADKVDYNNSHSLTDTMNVRMRDRLYIRMLTKNIAQVPAVEKAILDFVNNNSLLKARYESKIDEFKKKIVIAETELDRLDSLARITYFKEDNLQLNLGNNQVLLSEQRKQLFFGDLLGAQRIISESEFELVKMSAPVVIPSSLIVTPKALNSRLKYGVFGIIIGFVLGLLLAGLLESREKIVGFLNSK